MVPVSSQGKSRSAHLPRVLVVEDEPGLIELIGDVVRAQVDCRIVAASTLAQARSILSTHAVEVLVTDVHLPDGDGMSLLPELREHQPNASAIVITGSPSMDRAITAIRGGAIDFVTKPFSNAQLVERVRSAIERHSHNVKREQRIDRLRQAVKRLNDSRKLISKKVDLLCNDLVNAYGELSQQLDEMRTQDGFRKFIADSKDLEQLLCHSMDWLLREIGYANVAVFLASDDGVFQLGAYMKYTVAGETQLTDALRRVVVPMAVKDAIVHFPSKTLGDRLTPQEMKHLKGSDVLAVNCTYLGESLASIVFFRDEKGGFKDADVDLLKQIAPIFAVELASVVREAQGDEDDEAPFCETDTEVEDHAKKPKKRPQKKDPADWWKNGEDPPF
jgi:FixJ family two-component response regulator